MSYREATHTKYRLLLPSRPGEWRLDRVPRRIGTAQCLQTSEGAIQDHKSLQSRAPNNLLQRALSNQRCAEPLIKSKDRMYIVDNGASLHVMEVNSFTSQQKAAWKFKLRTASSVPPKSERFTSRNWWKSILQCCPLDDCTLSWDTPPRGNQEKAPNSRNGRRPLNAAPKICGTPRCGHKAIGYSIFGYDS